MSLDMTVISVHAEVMLFFLPQCRAMEGKKDVLLFLVL